MAVDAQVRGLAASAVLYNLMPRSADGSTEPCIGADSGATCHRPRGISAVAASPA